MKKVFIGLIGGTVLLIGLALLVLPGPGFPIVVAGLAILATEFFWARRAMRQAKGGLAKLRRRFQIKQRFRRHRSAAIPKTTF